MSDITTLNNIETLRAGKQVSGDAFHASGALEVKPPSGLAVPADIIGGVGNIVNRGKQGNLLNALNAKPKSLGSIDDDRHPPIPDKALANTPKQDDKSNVLMYVGVGVGVVLIGVSIFFAYKHFE